MKVIQGLIGIISGIGIIGDTLITGDLINWWHWNNPYWSNNTIIIPRQTRVRPNVQPRNTPPRTRPRFREPNERIRVNTPRGSNNQYTPRNNNNSNTRTRVNVGRRSDGGRRNNQ